MALGPDDITPNPDALMTQEELHAAFIALKREVRAAIGEMRRDFGQHVEASFNPLEDRVDEHDRQHEETRKAIGVLSGSVERVLSGQTKTGLGVERIEKKLDRLLVSK